MRSNELDVKQYSIVRVKWQAETRRSTFDVLGWNLDYPTFCECTGLVTLCTHRLEEGADAFIF